MYNRDVVPQIAPASSVIQHASLSNPHSARARHRRVIACPRFPPLRLLGRLPLEHAVTVTAAAGIQEAFSDKQTFAHRSGTPEMCHKPRPTCRLIRP